MEAEGESYHLMPSLYVGDLHSEVTEAMLLEKFSQIGEVLSARICRDVQTNKSLGYGYVNFLRVSDAQDALDRLNFEPLHGCPLRIMFSQRDPALRKSGIGNIFIKNLDHRIDNRKLYETFVKFGKILSCKIATDAGGISLGYGFVHFEAAEAAEKAMETANGLFINGKSIVVCGFKRRDERECDRFTNVYVKNFGDSLTEDQFRQMCAPFGKITSAKIMTFGDGKSKGFGFVAYENHISAARAVAALNGKAITSDRALFVGRAQNKNERRHGLVLQPPRAENITLPKGFNLYVWGLPLNYTNDDLARLLREFGAIRATKIIENGGYGYVCFSTVEEAERAVAGMNGKLLESKILKLRIIGRDSDGRSFLFPIRKPGGRLISKEDIYIPEQGNSASAKTKGTSRPGGNISVVNIFDAASPQQKAKLMHCIVFPEIQKHHPFLTMENAGTYLQKDLRLLQKLLESNKQLNEDIEDALRKRNI